MVIFLFVIACDSGIDDLGETVADDLNDGLLGNEVVDLPNEDEEASSTEESDANDEDAEAIPGKMLAKVNKNDFLSENKNKTKFLEEIIFVSANISTKDGFNYLAVRGIQILRLEPSKGLSIGLNILYLDIDNLNSGTIYNTVQNENNLFAESVSGSIVDNNEEIRAESLVTDKTKEISLKITEIDFERNVISGEFHFLAVDEETGDEYMVTDGVFTDVPLATEEYP